MLFFFSLYKSVIISLVIVPFLENGQTAMQTLYCAYKSANLRCGGCGAGEPCCIFNMPILVRGKI